MIVCYLDLKYTTRADSRLIVSSENLTDQGNGQLIGRGITPVVDEDGFTVTLVQDLKSFHG